MRNSRLLVPALVMVGAAALLSGSVGASADSFPRVSANADVSQNNKSPVRDMSTANVATDPKDAKHIAIVAGDWRLGTCYLYVSSDGGATWAVGKRSPLPANFDTCTPNGGTNAWGIAFDNSGNILVALLAANRPSTTAASGSIVLSKTTDNGNNWSSTFVKDNRNTNPQQGAGQIQMAVDNAHDRVFVAWQQRGVVVAGYTGTQRRAEVATSNDGGATFGTPVDAEGDPSSTLSIGGPNISVGPDGTLWIYYSQSAAPKTATAVFTSQKNGLKLAKTTDGTSITQVGTIDATAPTFFGFADFAAGSYKGGTALVFIYEAIAQGTAGSQYQLRDIYSQNSLDGGQTWNSPVRVTDDDIQTDLGNKFTPGINAAPNGRFDAAWIDFRNDTGSLLSDTYYASSSDGGTTWSKNIKVSDAQSDRHYGQFANNSDVRSNVNLASNNYAANIAWDDTRKASSTQDVTDVEFGAVQQAAIPDTTSTTVLYIVAAIAGGLVAAALILLVVGLVIRNRRGGGRPTASPPKAGATTAS